MVIMIEDRMTELAGPSDKRHIGFASAKMKKSYERRSRQLKPKLLL